jgi:hypothetical protein
MGGYNVSPAGFAAMISALMRLPTPRPVPCSTDTKAVTGADTALPGIKIVLSLEGGYDLGGLALSAEAVVRALLQGDGDTLDSDQFRKEPEDIVRELFMQCAGRPISSISAAEDVAEDNGVHPFTVKVVDRIKRDFSLYWKCLSS